MATNKHPQTLSKRPDFLGDGRRGRTSDARDLKHVGNVLPSEETREPLTDQQGPTPFMNLLLSKGNKRKKRTGEEIKEALVTGQAK